VREAQETVKQLRRIAPSTIHDATGKLLASQSKDLEDVLTTGVIDKSVPARVRVPSDLCASAINMPSGRSWVLTLVTQQYATLPRLQNA
jgi:hypothetical protein